MRYGSPLLNTIDVNRVFTEFEDRPGMQEITLDEFEKLKRSSDE